MSRSPEEPIHTELTSTERELLQKRITARAVPKPSSRPPENDHFTPKKAAQVALTREQVETAGAMPTKQEICARIASIDPDVPVSKLTEVRAMVDGQGVTLLELSVKTSDDAPSPSAYVYVHKTGSRFGYLNGERQLQPFAHPGHTALFRIQDGRLAEIYRWD